ncbi:MAG: radical SAM protein [bacterium]
MIANVRTKAKTKILFIIPPHISFRQYIHPAFNERVLHKKNGDFGSVLTDMPLGVLAISSYIKKHAEAEVRLIDFNIVLNKLDEFNFSSFQDFFRDQLKVHKMAGYEPDIIGISALFTPAYRNMLDISLCCREIFPPTVIVAGGSVPTNLYKEIFAESNSFDGLCFGEGEKPFLALVKATDKKRLLCEHDSWITQEKVQANRSYQHDFIEDLDQIPFTDYSICKMTEYGRNPAITAYASLVDQNQNFHVMTSRGCPHRCCFCSSHTVHGRQMRYYSVARVKEDFQRLRDQYGAKILVFQDDHFVADRKRALEIIGIVKELNLRAVFQNGLALYALDRPILEALRSAGVDQLLLSVESGSARVLKEIMHKPLDLTIVQRVANDCRQLGIYTNVNILIGLPGETKQDIQDARDFLKTINANWFLIFCANPLVGSEMFDICREKKHLKGDHIDCDYKKAVVETEDFSAEYIQDMAYIMNLELNFVENSDFRLGNYAIALKGFESAIKAKDDHALAYFCAARCYDKLGERGKAGQYMSKAKEIVKNSAFWRKYAEMFNLPI